MFAESRRQSEHAGASRQLDETLRNGSRRAFQQVEHHIAGGKRRESAPIIINITIIIVILAVERTYALESLDFSFLRVERLIRILLRRVKE